MSGFVWPSVVDAAISSFRATLAAVAVYDTIPVTSDPLGLALVVGASLDDDTGAAGTITSDQHDLGPWPGESRDETGTIRCTVIAQDGGADVAAQRAKAFEVLGAVSDLCRLDPSLGVDQVQWVEVRSVTPSQGLSPQGSFCELSFSLAYKALI